MFYQAFVEGSRKLMQYCRRNEKRILIGRERGFRAFEQHSIEVIEGKVQVLDIGNAIDILTENKGNIRSFDRESGLRKHVLYLHFYLVFLIDKTFVVIFQRLFFVLANHH